MSSLRNTVKQCNVLKTRLNTEIAEYTEVKNASFHLLRISVISVVKDEPDDQCMVGT